MDVGTPPAGAERAQRFWAGILTGRITRAILSRPVTDGTPLAWVIFEEVQEALSSSGQADQFARLLALARHKRVGVTLVNQQAGQLAAVDSTLVKILRTNAGIECAFRANLEDAKSIAHAMPLPPRQRKPGEARLEMVTELTQMQDREFRSGSKQAPFGAQRVRSPRIDLARFRRIADETPADIRSFMRRGGIRSDGSRRLGGTHGRRMGRIGMNAEAAGPAIRPDAGRRHRRLG